MITRIEISGFKSLQGFALDLGPFTSLIGPNGAGKSNVLDALGLLSRLASGDLATALSSGRGRIREQFGSLDTTPEKGFGVLGRMDLAVEVLLLAQENAASGAAKSAGLPFTRLRYEASIELHAVSPVLERCVLARDRLIALPPSDSWLQSHAAFSAQARHGRGELLFAYELSSGDLQRSDPASPVAHGSLAVQSPPQHTHLTDRNELAASAHLAAMAEELRRLRVVHLEPALLREPSERGAPPMTASGAHLATALAALSPDRMARVRARLAALLPGARTVDVVARDDSLLIELELTDGRRFTSRVLSDGTLRILALLALIESSDGRTIAIEEPENGVHPARMRGLLQILRESASPGDAGSAHQIVVTSHSPAVLAALMDHPEEIACIDMVRHGAGPRVTRVRRIATGGATDRGEKTVSRHEIERLLATAIVAEPEGSGP